MPGGSAYNTAMHIGARLAASARAWLRHVTSQLAHAAAPAGAPILVRVGEGPCSVWMSQQGVGCVLWGSQVGQSTTAAPVMPTVPVR